jgi:hypothetical protein
MVSTYHERFRAGTYKGGIWEVRGVIAQNVVCRYDKDGGIGVRWDGGECLVTMGRSVAILIEELD